MGTGASYVRCSDAMTYHLALSFRRRDYSAILHIAVSPIHQYRSEPSLHFYSLWYYYFHSVLTGQFTQQWEFCLHLLTLLSLQTFMFGIVWGGGNAAKVNSYCLVTHIFQNIIFFVQLKKEPHTGLQWHEGEYMMTEFLFLGELTLWCLTLSQKYCKSYDFILWHSQNLDFFIIILFKMLLL